MAYLVKAGSISWDSAADLTTEKFSDVISLNVPCALFSGYFLLAVEKPSDDTAGNLTVNTYNVINFDGTNVRNVLHTTHTVEQLTDGTYRDFLIQGLFAETEGVKIGMKFATDSGAITVRYRLYSLWS
jgi:hypothetical protein